MGKQSKDIEKKKLAKDKQKCVKWFFPLPFLTIAYFLLKLSTFLLIFFAVNEAFL